MSEVRSVASGSTRTQGILSFLFPVPRRVLPSDGRSESDLAAWLDRYLWASGVVDPGVRRRLIRRIRKTLGDGMASWTEGSDADVAELQRRVGDALLADRSLWVEDDLRRLCWGRLLVRHGSGTPMPDCSPARFASPPPQRADMPAQDLSTWSPRELLWGWSHPRILHRLGAVATALMAAVFGGR